MRKFRFIQDDSCHWYLIPLNRTREFDDLMAGGEETEAEFNNKFSEFRSMHPSQYFVENPKEYP